MPDLNWIFFVVFATITIVDEIIGNRKRRTRNFKHLLFQFIGLELTALVVSIYTNTWILFYAVFLYDIGYLIVDIFFAEKGRVGEHHKERKRRIGKKKIEAKITHHRI